jgi:hypothetical protein
MSLEWLAYFEHIVYSKKHKSPWHPFSYPHLTTYDSNMGVPSYYYVGIRCVHITYPHHPSHGHIAQVHDIHPSLEMVCSMEIYTLYAIIIDEPALEWSKPFEINQPQTYRGSRIYGGWMRSTLVCVKPLSIISTTY